MQSARVTTAGYTLIELLVVIALIAVLTAAVGLGLRGSSDANALAAAGGVLRAQLEAARSRATLRGVETGVAFAVDTDDASENLRALAVVEKRGDDGAWVAIDDSVRLPGSVRMTEPPEGDALWEAPVTVEWEVGGGTKSCYLVRFQTDGGLGRAGGGELRWATDSVAHGGIRVSRYGAITVLTDEETR